MEASDPTVKEATDYKRRLEKAVFGLVKDYEEHFKCNVMNIEVVRIDSHVPLENTKLVAVRINVEIK